MLYYERQAKKKGYTVIVGIDEVGRGPLAGPVVVAAVYLKSFKFKNRIDDSKKLSARQREAAFFEISEKSVFGVGVMSEAVVDSVNISRAAKFAVDAALLRLFAKLKRPKTSLKNTILLLDGKLSSGLPYDSKEIIKGDTLSMSIASASILAKVIRDRFMNIYDKCYPYYGFSVHKGYGTRKHFGNIARYGLSPIHRRTFCRSFA